MTPAEVLETRTAPVIAAAAVAVVVLSAALFSLVGAVRGDSAQADEVAAPAASPSPVDGDDAGSTAGDDSSAAPSDVAAPTDDDTASAPDDDAADSEDAATDQEPAAEPTDDEAAGDDDEDPSDEPLSEVDPATVSIQVLDAAGDGGAAASATADQLREAGFDVIVVNGASRGYAVTTVFWTDGQGPGGRAVAAAVGAAEAQRTPDEVRLSDSVDVHVVVGADKT